MNLLELNTRVFADGADLESLLSLAREPFIKGFTTNPTLMRKAGISDYERFAREVLEQIVDRPISFEVFSDDLETMRSQAHAIASWGPNVFVKIPVTNTEGAPTHALVGDLSRDGVQVNVTALMTLEQVEQVARALEGGAPSNISIFAGRIADTGRDPVPLMRKALEIASLAPQAEVIWASPREVLNIVQAHEIACPIITVTHDLLAKTALLGKSLEQFSLETVEMFHGDAVAAGYTIATADVR